MDYNMTIFRTRYNYVNHDDFCFTGKLYDDPLVKTAVLGLQYYNTGYTLYNIYFSTEEDMVLYKMKYNI